MTSVDGSGIAGINFANAPKWSHSPSYVTTGPNFTQLAKSNPTCNDLQVHKCQRPFFTPSEHDLMREFYETTMVTMNMVPETLLNIFIRRRCNDNGYNNQQPLNKALTGS